MKTLILLLISVSSFAQCNCDFVITAAQSAKDGYHFDGAKYKVKPGSKVCLEVGTRTGIGFFNLQGTKDLPITITSCGKTILAAPANWGNAVEFVNCSFVHFTGGTTDFNIEVSGATQGINFHALSNHVEMDHVYIHDTGNGPGVVAKTDPTCSSSTWRGNFTMEDVIFHDNKIENVGTEGFYIGNSHYDGGVVLTCNGVSTKVLEHDLINVWVYDNTITNAGNEGIQISGAQSATVHDNIVTNPGCKNADPAQANGMAINAGTRVNAYNNYIDGGKGFSIIDAGGGGTYAYNVVKNSKLGGIQLQDTAPNFDSKGFWVHNNQFVNCGTVGVHFYSVNPVMSYFTDNLLLTDNPAYTYIKLNSTNVKFSESGNLKVLGKVITP